jgi:hypothetical protein
LNVYAQRCLQSPATSLASQAPRFTLTPPLWPCWVHAHMTSIHVSACCLIKKRTFTHARSCSLSTDISIVRRDKGPGDIRLCRQLVSLKRRHPDRVFLLVGNRDLNKLRYAAELAPDDMQRDIDDIPPPHWDPLAPTLRQHLESAAAALGCTVNEVNTRTERLLYMQRHTLGMPRSFEFRRREVAVLTGCDAGTVSDEDVVSSFVDDVCDPNGALRQYLENACVAVTLGNTLFVHGAVDDRTAGIVPAPSTRFELPVSEPPHRTCDTVSEWVVELNRLLCDGLDDFARRPWWDDSRTTRGGEALMALQNREATAGRTVVSNCYGDGGVITTDDALERRRKALAGFAEDGDYRRFAGVCSNPADKSVNAWLVRGGVHRVVVGHKPTGDCPAVLAGHANGTCNAHHLLHALASPTAH